MKLFLVKTLLPIIFTSITCSSLLLLTNCEKKATNYDYSSWYNYGSDNKSYNIQGTDWIGYKSGNLTIETDSEDKAWIVSNDAYTAKDLVIPKKVVDASGKEYKISNYADFTFSSGSITGSVSIPPTFITIGGYKSNIKNEYIFNFPNADEVRVPHGTINIDNYAISAKKIILSNSVTQIVSNAFGNILKEIYISDSVKTIGMHAFSNCSSLVSISIPNSVKSIGSFAFSDCTALESIDIPVSVATIGYSAFYGWNEDKTIILNREHPVSLIRDNERWLNSFKLSDEKWYFSNCKAKIVCSDGYYTQETTTFVSNK